MSPAEIEKAVEAQQEALDALCELGNGLANKLVQPDALRSLLSQAPAPQSAEVEEARNIRSIQLALETAMSPDYEPPRGMSWEDCVLQLKGQLKDAEAALRASRAPEGARLWTADTIKDAPKGSYYIFYADSAPFWSKVHTPQEQAVRIIGTGEGWAKHAFGPLPEPPAPHKEKTP